jgi:hypothetical protein
VLDIVVVDVQMRSIDLIDMNLNTSKGLEKTQITTRVDDKSKLKSTQPSIIDHISKPFSCAICPLLLSDL